MPLSSSFCLPRDMRTPNPGSSQEGTGQATHYDQGESPQAPSRIYNDRIQAYRASGHRFVILDRIKLKNDPVAQDFLDAAKLAHPQLDFLPDKAVTANGNKKSMFTWSPRPTSSPSYYSQAKQTCAYVEIPIPQHCPPPSPSLPDTHAHA